MLQSNRRYVESNHRGLLFKLRSFGIGGHHHIISNFLTDRRQHFLIYGLLGLFGRVKSGIPRDSLLGFIPFNLYMANMWTVIESHMVAYTGDTSNFIPIFSNHDRSVLLKC